jgi:hypothetical protein
MMENLVGKRFGRLEVLEFDHSRISPSTKGRVNRYYYWKCRCDCGNIQIATVTSLRYGHSQSCGCLHKELARERGHKNRKGFGESSFNCLLSSYKSAARRRNLDFKLTDDEFKLLTSGNCVYCGIEPKQSDVKNTRKRYGTYIYNGIDRQDNSRGYEFENCVSCCRRCNTAKLSMTVDEFYEWVDRVHYGNPSRMDNE